MTDLELARECGAVSLTFVNRVKLPESMDGVAFHPDDLAKFTERIRKEEREACAEVAEYSTVFAKAVSGSLWDRIAKGIAAAIRARAGESQ